MLGFTDHDVAVSFDSLAYDAATGFTASEVQSTLGLAVDNLTVAGALSAASLNEADLAAGLFDDADIEIWRVNWASPDQRVLMRKGSLGQVTRGKTAFSCEVRGLAHRLNQPVGRVYGYSCDADLGDARCGKDISGAAFTASATVLGVIDNRRFTTAGLGAYASGWFSGGKLVFTTGANAGRAMEVKRHGAGSLELWQAMSEVIAPGRRLHRQRRMRQAVRPPARRNSPMARTSAAFPTCPATTRRWRRRPSRSRSDGGSRYGH